MKLNNGDQVISVSKPKSEGTVYYWTDDSGMKHAMPQSRVVKIEPVSVVREQETPSSPPKPQKPKHWYFLWLACISR